MTDELGIMASPLVIIYSRGSRVDIDEVVNLVKKHGVERIVVGMPRSMDGSLGKEALRVQKFIELLSKSSPVPVVYWDERLSTVAAEREMNFGGATPSQKRQWLDAVAASIVLQAYMDSLRDPQHD
ncbi:MAG: Holliday junction resolvase YqgF [Dehalococcoidia bacterium]|nr:Holliday junction resolvase YqgF [Dehalococcoidia bacterium]